MSILLKNVYALDGFMERANLCDVVVNNGEISAIYDAGKCPVHADETVDGKCRTAVIPGFVNGHTHAAMSLLRGLGEEKPLMEWLKEQIWPVEANLTPEHIYWGTKLAILEMASRGVTCFADMYFEMDQVAKAVLESGMRAGLCRGLIGEDEAKLEEASRFFHNWNGKEGLINVQFGPHAPYTLSREMLERITTRAVELDAGVHFHFLEAEWEAGYLSSEFGMTPAQYLESTGLTNVPYLVLAHCVWFPESDMPYCADKKITFCHNVKSNMKLGSGIFPFEKVRENNINISLGTDGAASNNQLDIWDEMKTAALLHKGILKDPSIAKAADLLKMATFGGAQSLGFEKTGRIMENWKADLTLVDLDRPHYVGVNEENLCCFLVYAGSSSDITSTMVDGKWIYRDGSHTGTDQDRVIREASRCRSELLRKR